MTNSINKANPATVNLSQIESVHIKARRWFQKSYGNTYFSLVVDVEVAGNTIKVVNVPFEYGDGTHYDTVALEQFKQVIDIAPGELSDYYHSLSRALREAGIPVYNHVSDVERKKDL